MTSMILVLASTILWQVDFTDDASALHQLYDYHVDIVHHESTVKLTANPQFEGFASAWLHVDEEIGLSDDDALTMRIRGNEISVRIRYFFRKGKCANYYAGEKTILVGNKWQDVAIPLKYAIFFSGTEFPAALTPGKNPAFYLFIENGESGHFDVEIDHISIVRHGRQVEEQ